MRKLMSFMQLLSNLGLVLVLAAFFIDLNWGEVNLNRVAAWTGLVLIALSGVVTLATLHRHCKKMVARWNAERDRRRQEYAQAQANG